MSTGLWLALVVLVLVRAGNVPRPECIRGPEFPAARSPGDLNDTFLPIMRGEKFSEYKPKVLSVDPWIVLFEAFMNRAEVDEYHELINTQTFMPSTVMGQKGARTSHTAQCNPPCDESLIYQVVQKRASSIVRIPQENFETTQTTKYPPNTYFRVHHDHAASFNELPPGPRLFTVFVYLTDVEEGGETHFPRLNINVPAKAGQAIIFVNTLDEDPYASDGRMLHEGKTVLKGEKVALNMWVRQYSYMEFWRRNCNRKEDIYSDSQHHGPQDLVFHNYLDAPVDIFWVNNQDESEVPMGSVGVADRINMNSFVGHKFMVRAKPRGKATEGAELMLVEVPFYTGRYEIKISPDRLPPVRQRDEL